MEQKIIIANNVNSLNEKIKEMISEENVTPKVIETVIDYLLKNP